MKKSKLKKKIKKLEREIHWLNYVTDVLCGNDENHKALIKAGRTLRKAMTDTIWTGELSPKSNSTARIIFYDHTKTTEDNEKNKNK